MLDIANDNASLMFNMNKPKYAILDEVFTNASRHFVIYLDSVKLFEAFRQKYTQNVCSTIIDEKLTHNLTAEFFNYVGHWRNYFSAMGVKTTFILLHGNSDTLIEEIEPGWNSDYRINENLPKANKFIDFTIKKLISQLAPMVPRVFVVDSNNLPSGQNLTRAAIPYILEQTGEVSGKTSKLIFTNDLGMIQNIYKLGKTSIIRGNSKAIRRIEPGRLFEFLSRDYKVEITGIPDSFLPAYYAMMGDAGLNQLCSSVGKAVVIKRLQSVGNREEETVLTDEFIANMFSDKIKPAELDNVKNFIGERLDFFNVSNRVNLVSDSDIIALTAQLNTYHTSPDVTEELTKSFFAYNTQHFGDLINMRALF